MPPEPVLSAGWQEKRRLSAAYGTKAALRSPPHVTVLMPFLWRADRLASLLPPLEQVAKATAPFPMALDGYGHFGERVIYWQVVASLALTHLQGAIHRAARQQLHLDLGRERPFHPHLTLAFRDLKKEAFRQAWTAVRSRPYEAQWQARGLSLLRHDGSQWHELACMPFKGQ